MIREPAQPGFEDRSSGPNGDQRGSVERRADARARTLVAGKLVIGEELVDCVVRNISVRGAQVRALGAVEVPSTVGLLLTSDGLLFDATVVWRDGDKFGVTFSGSHDLHQDSDPSRAKVRELWKDWLAR